MADACDLPTLLSLRLTSGDLGEHVQNVLETDRKTLLLHYVNNADLFLEHLRETRALVGGLAALSFILRDPSLRPTTLDVYVSSDQGELLEQRLEDDMDLDLELNDVVDQDPVLWFNTPRHTSRVCSYLCPDGRAINVHTSVSLSALDPIAMSGTTALINWVSPYAFGCGYPALTLRRRAFGHAFAPSWPDLPALYDRLRANGFDLAPDPWSWPEYVSLLPPATGAWFRPCMRTLYLCPDQGRFFGDDGSLLNVFSLHDTDHDHLRELHQTPYGISIAWRLCFGGKPCNGRCPSTDPVLPEGVLTIPAVMISHRIQFRATYVGPHTVQP